MNPTVVIWILAVVVAVLVGREVGKWLFGENAKLQQKKRAAQTLAGKLRASGLQRIPTFLEAFALGDLQAMFEQIHDLAKLVEAGSDVIEKELATAYERVLNAKLATPEGLAFIKAKIAAQEGGPAAPVAPASEALAAPAPVAPQAVPVKS